MYIYINLLATGSKFLWQKGRDREPGCGYHTWVVTCDRQQKRLLSVITDCRVVYIQREHQHKGWQSLVLSPNNWVSSFREFAAAFDTWFLIFDTFHVLPMFYFLKMTMPTRLQHTYFCFFFHSMWCQYQQIVLQIALVALCKRLHRPSLLQPQVKNMIHASCAFISLSLPLSDLSS